MPDFLYIAKLADAEGENGEEWEGRIKAMTRSIRRSFESLKTEILSKIRGEIVRDADVTQARQKEVTDNQDKLKKELKEEMKKQDEKMDEIKEEMMKKQDEKMDEIKKEIKEEIKEKFDEIMEFLKS